MRRVNLTFALVVALAAPAAPQVTQSDLSGEWRLASAMTNMTRDGGTGEQSTKTYLVEGAAFNCGRGCRILYKGSTVTVENAQIEADATTRRPTVSIVVDGRSHEVPDSVTLGNTIETVGRWEDGKLVIASTFSGLSTSQMISIEQNQLVVVTSFAYLPGTKLTLRYAKE